MQALTIRDLRAAYAAGKTVAETISELLARCAASKDPAIWISPPQEKALLAEAARLDADPKVRKLPLFGIPFAAKDNIDGAGFATTAGCPAYAYQPKADSTVVARLKAAGAILVGKTNLDQFATGLVGTRSPYGAPRSVFNADYISGGSSAGSAVAVGAGLVAFSLGTDTAGSGRVPASFNNIVGLKPTRGRLSIRGVVPACRSLDCVSIFAHSAEEAQIVAAVAGGFDPEDPYSRPYHASPALPEAFRFGILSPEDREKDFLGDADCAAQYQAAVEKLSDMGGQAVTIDYSPFREAAELLYEGAWVAERTVAVEDFLRDHAEEMDPTVRTIISGGLKLSAMDAFKCEYKLAACRRLADQAWAEMDLMVLPTAAKHYTVAEVMADPIRTNSNLGRFTNWVNLLDCCGIAVPSGFRANGLPFGVTLLAPAGADDALCPLGYALHKLSGTGMGGAKSPLPEL